MVQINALKTKVMSVGFEATEKLLEMLAGTALELVDCSQIPYQASHCGNRSRRQLSAESIRISPDRIVVTSQFENS